MVRGRATARLAPPPPPPGPSPPCPLHVAFGCPSPPHPPLPPLDSCLAPPLPTPSLCACLVRLIVCASSLPSLLLFNRPPPTTPLSPGRGEGGGWRGGAAREGGLWGWGRGGLERGARMGGHAAAAALLLQLGQRASPGRWWGVEALRVRAGQRRQPAGSGSGVDRACERVPARVRGGGGQTTTVAAPWEA